jgi:hypothetical protein
MSKLGTITLKGKSGAKYAFNVFSRSTGFKALGAIYFMTKRTVDSDGDASHTLIYVGETGDLSDRPITEAPALIGMERIAF